MRSGVRREFMNPDVRPQDDLFEHVGDQSCGRRAVLEPATPGTLGVFSRGECPGELAGVGGRLRPGQEVGVCGGGHTAAV